MWECIWQVGDVHIWPLNDLIAHEIDCPCLPITEPVADENGTISWLIIHNAWDGRP